MDDRRTLILAGAIVLGALILGLSLFFALRKTPEQICLERGGTWVEDEGFIGARPGCHEF